ncbi:MAG: hypothetical protein P4L56_14865, partial [Candidatus Sulfopaludibacter sp.]|nr:hypothetical protein [Candidatus Sulfopaludibacter sp.]
METNAPVFDATRPVAVQLRGPDGSKTVRVRFPSDDEWTERQRRRKVIVKQLGRGISETTIPNGEEIDAALLAKIRTEEEPEVDAFEAQKVIEQLAKDHFALENKKTLADYLKDEDEKHRKEMEFEAKRYQERLKNDLDIAETFIIDGTSIYVGLTAGLAQTADQVAADINVAFGAAGLAATADVTDDGCVRVTSTKPVGEGEINVYGGTGMGTIGLPLGTWAGAGAQWHVHGLATAESAVQNLADAINNASSGGVAVTGPDQSGVIEATASGKTLTIAFKTSPPPATVMGKLGNGEIVTVRSWHDTVPVDARDASYDASKDVQGVTFGANRSIRFAGGDNDTKYHISLPLGALTDKNSQTVPTLDCRKMYMVFAPRFEIVEEALDDGCFLTADAGPGDTIWSVDSGAALTGGRYFIGDATSEERVLLVAGGASSIHVQRGYES